jgi:hypothetical protein
VVDVLEHRLEDGADRVPADGRPAGREAHHGVGLVERGEAFGVAGVRPLDEQPGDVLGLGGAGALGGHRIPRSVGFDGVTVAAVVQKSKTGPV